MLWRGVDFDAASAQGLDLRRGIVRLLSVREQTDVAACLGLLDQGRACLPHTHTRESDTSTSSRQLQRCTYFLRRDDEDEAQMLFRAPPHKSMIESIDWPPSRKNMMVSFSCRAPSKARPIVDFETFFLKRAVAFSASAVCDALPSAAISSTTLFSCAVSRGGRPIAFTTGRSLRSSTPRRPPLVIPAPRAAARTLAPSLMSAFAFAICHREGEARHVVPFSCCVVLRRSLDFITTTHSAGSFQQHVRTGSLTCKCVLMATAVVLPEAPDACQCGHSHGPPTHVRLLLLLLMILTHSFAFLLLTCIVFLHLHLHLHHD